jgi:penicillin-binding protein 1A
VLATVRSAARALTPWPALAPMRQLLASAVRNGTGNAARLPLPTFGKTGTTQNHRDALFIGYAGGLVVGVWVGNDDNSPMNGIVGGSIPARLWKRFMLAALAHDGVLRTAALTPAEGEAGADAADALADLTVVPDTQGEPDAAANTDGGPSPLPAVPVDPPPQAIAPQG